MDNLSRIKISQLNQRGSYLYQKPTGYVIGLTARHWPEADFMDNRLKTEEVFLAREFIRASVRHTILLQYTGDKATVWCLPSMDERANTASVL